jgi:hypothetical protein
MAGTYVSVCVKFGFELPADPEQAARQVREMTTADLLDRGERVVVSVIVGRMVGE